MNSGLFDEPTTNMSDEQRAPGEKRDE